MPRTRLRYPPESRREAIRLLVRASDEDRPITKIARELALNIETLRKWLKSRTRDLRRPTPQGALSTEG